jgi:hypothetical protein
MRSAPQREEGAVGATGGAESKEVLEVREALGDLGDQLRREEQRRCGGWRGAASLAVSRRRAASPAVGHRHFCSRP